MWIHVVIFILIFGSCGAWKAGWLPMEGLGDEKGRRMFLMVALAGNLLGMAITLQGSQGADSRQEYRLPKEETGAYEKEFLVSVDGKDAASIYVQIPEKETEEEAQEEPVKEPSKKEKQEKELKDAIALYNQERNDPDYYYLPDSLDGRTLEWKQPKDRSGALLASLSLFAGLVLLVKKAREEQEALVRRSEQLFMDYPGLVMKFTLLVQAGMTVRKAFQKIGTDYRRRNGGKERFAYEEVLTACYEMDSGISEMEAYRRFGERCGQIQYKTLATLLIQNLQKGSRRMVDLLEKEALEAWDERKRKARVLGEAAATKLLFPMVLMLLVVMAIIMVPAFLSFYS